MFFKKNLRIYFLSIYLDGNIQLKITSEQYINYGKQENIVLKYYIHSQIKETNQTFTRNDNIVFNKHDIVKPVSQFFMIEFKFSKFLSDS
jgi:hypothetical protein